MSEIQFDEDNKLRPSFKSRTILGAPSTPRMVQALLKTGIVKNEKTAGYVLISLSFLCFAIAFIIFYILIYSNNPNIQKDARNNEINQAILNATTK
jgi:hypothetical protein